MPKNARPGLGLGLGAELCGEGGVPFMSFILIARVAGRLLNRQRVELKYLLGLTNHPVPR